MSGAGEVEPGRVMPEADDEEPGLQRPRRGGVEPAWTRSGADEDGPGRAMP